MSPAMMQKISAEQCRDMREQAAAWRRARQAGDAVPARRTRIWFTRIAPNTRRARSLAGQPRPHGQAAA